MNKLENKVLQELVEDKTLKYIGREDHGGGVEDDYDNFEYKGMFLSIWYRETYDNISIGIEIDEEIGLEFVDINNITKEQFIKELEDVRSRFKIDTQRLKELEDIFLNIMETLIKYGNEEYGALIIVDIMNNAKVFKNKEEKDNFIDYI